jgi:thiamine pyrophosphate-dependent acetolactate synthase large subunit-like protein
MSEVPEVPEHVRGGWGSDAMAEALRATGIPYIALNPGASYRGLHDSIVNYLGNERPQMLLCLHEEHAVAIAHGYAKVSGVPMAAAVHSNVGLMHATMAIFNAFCDRVPMLVVGATGPLDAEQRRPWIDWIHTAADQAALIRQYVKWDDQPTSPGAAVASLLRANQLTRSYPSAPVYVSLDAEAQEQSLPDQPSFDASRYAAIDDPAPSPRSVAAAADLLVGGVRPLILAGRVSRDEGDWGRRVELAERLGADVVTDLKVGAAFPTDHPLHRGAPGLFVSPENLERVRAADVILSLDWVDLGGVLRQACKGAEPAARVISVSADHHLWNGWTKNDHVLAAVDVSVQCRPDVAVAELLRELRSRGASTSRRIEPTVRETAGARAEPTGPTGKLTVRRLAHTLRHLTAETPVTLVRLPFAWNPDDWPLRAPLDYLGIDGGGGVGSGPGMAVGAALALRGTGRLPVAVLGDGDYLMGLTALWTAARYEIPLLVVVANNSSFFNDEIHQDRVARTRLRPVENAHIGMRMEGPEPDLAQLARGQGLEGIGPVLSPDELDDALERALESVRAGCPTVVDVRVECGYGSAIAAAIASKHE